MKTIKHYRELLGLNQFQMARVMELGDQSAYQKFENSKGQYIKNYLLLWDLIKDRVSGNEFLDALSKEILDKHKK